MNEQPEMNPEYLMDPTQGDPSKMAERAKAADLHAAVAPQGVKGETSSWFSRDVSDELRTKWDSIQAQFIDQPRACVEQAEALVAEAVDRINSMYTEEQNRLSEQWCNHEDASTEELRITLQNYRSFLHRILDQ